ncbi:hypothetical protein DYB28_014986, partial [Aphanomyces astaci]
GNCGVTVEIEMADEGKKRKANEIAKDADDSVEEAEAPAQQVEVVDLTAESDDDDGVPPTLGKRGGRQEGKSGRRGEGESKARQRGQGEVKAELVGPERTGLTRDEVFELELGFHWDRSRIFTPAGWGGVDLEYVRGVTRHLTVVREFDETREDWGYQVANAAGVERYLRLFASAQSFELRVLWMLLAMECMQLARVSFHRFDEFKGAMRELHERECLERWTRTADPSLSIANPRSRSRGRSAVPGRSSPRGQAAMSAAAQMQGARVPPGGFLVLPASAWLSVWASPTASSSTWAREDAQVAARLSAARPTNPFAGYNPPSGPQQDGQLTAAERQAAAVYRAGARAIVAPQQVVVPMSRTATVGESEEEEKSEAAEEEEPPRDPKDRLPSLYRS